MPRPQAVDVSTTELLATSLLDDKADLKGLAFPKEQVSVFDAHDGSQAVAAKTAVAFPGRRLKGGARGRSVGGRSLPGASQVASIIDKSLQGIADPKQSDFKDSLFKQHWHKDQAHKATANIIAFSEAATITHSVTVESSRALVLSFENEKAETNTVEAELAVLFVGFGPQAAGDAEHESANSREASVARETATETTVEFTLGDSTPGDMFDVEIKRDPVYGTPVFLTHAGRSMCPYEANTNNRQRYEAEIYTPNAGTVTPKLYTGLDATKNTASGQVTMWSKRGNGSPLCASLEAMVTNRSPTGDQMQLEAALDIQNGDVADLVISINGITFEGRTMQMAMLTGPFGFESKIRFDLCINPNANGMQVFDTNMRAAPGGDKHVYCNLVVVVKVKL